MQSVTVNAARCDACGICVEVCCADAMRLEDGVVTIDEDECVLCLACVPVCPQDAIVPPSRPPRQIPVPAAASAAAVAHPAAQPVLVRAPPPGALDIAARSRVRSLQAAPVEITIEPLDGQERVGRASPVEVTIEPVDGQQRVQRAPPVEDTIEPADPHPGGTLARIAKWLDRLPDAMAAIDVLRSLQGEQRGGGRQGRGGRQRRRGGRGGGGRGGGRGRGRGCRR